MGVFLLNEVVLRFRKGLARSASSAFIVEPAYVDQRHTAGTILGQNFLGAQAQDVLGQPRETDAGLADGNNVRYEQSHVAEPVALDRHAALSINTYRCVRPYGLVRMPSAT